MYFNVYIEDLMESFLKNSLDLIAFADELRLLSFQQFPIGPGYLSLQLLKYFICICNI